MGTGIRQGFNLTVTIASAALVQQRLRRGFYRKARSLPVLVCTLFQDFIGRRSSRRGSARDVDGDGLWSSGEERALSSWLTRARLLGAVTG